MAKKLYVGNLPFSTTEDELYSMFKEHGTVKSAKLISDKFTGQSRGFGFVEMENDAEADSAIEKLNEKEVGERKMVVNEARPQEPRTGGSGGGGGFGGGRGGSGGGRGGSRGGSGGGGGNRW